MIVSEISYICPCQAQNYIKDRTVYHLLCLFQLMNGGFAVHSSVTLKITHASYRIDNVMKIILVCVSSL
jgi:hypothetical protein